ncbi:MAG: LruC domain-containing protein [Proteiniphilum sp.]
MRPKISLFSFTLVLTLFAIMLMLPGCEVDYYDPEANPGTGNSLFGDSVTVPASFDWSTMRTIAVSVKVDDRYDGGYYYTVELFDSNPLFDANANLLSKGVGKANMDYKASVVIPASIETIYIQQTNPTGGKTIAPVNISSSSVDYTFTTVGTTTRLATTDEYKSDSKSFFRAATDKYIIPALPANHTVITQTSGNLSKNLNDGTILINGNFSGTTSFWGKGDIFVSGTLNVTSGHLPVPDGSRLIILPGGSVTTPEVNSWGIVEVFVAGRLAVNNQFGVPTNSKCIVLQGGTLTCNALDIQSLFYNNGDIDVADLIKTNDVQAEILNDNVIQTKRFEIATEGAKLNNNGTIVVAENLKVSNRNGNITNTNSIAAQSLTFENGTMENEGVIFIEGHTRATNSNVLLINNNSFTTNTMYVSSSAVVQNNCHLTVNDLLELEDAKVTINSGGLLTTSKLTVNNTRIELNSAAMMHVTTLATYKYNNSSIGHGFYGTGSSKALLKLEKATYDNKNKENIIHYQGNLEVECYDHTAELLNNKRKRWTQNGITWAGAGGSTLVIPSTECNNGGYNNTPPTPPSNPVFPIIYEGSVVTYLFEDNWPNLGDFDMNDLVLDVTPTYFTNENNKITKLNLNVNLQALGASKRLGVGIQLDGVTPEKVSGFSRSNTAGINGNVFSLGNRLESEQTYAVIPVFDDAHEAMGLSSAVITNTVKGSGNYITPANVTIITQFSNPLDQAVVSIDKFNVFIINGGYKSKRQEIHLAGFRSTDRADKSKFGFADDNSNVSPYTSKDNLIWGLAVPESVKYPVEWTSIKVAYPEFESWATSNGSSSKEWYKNPNADAIFSR